MFYPIKSLLYTINITRTIYQKYKQRYFFHLGTVFILSAAIIISFFYAVSFAVLLMLSLWISIIDIYDKIIPDILLVIFGFLLSVLMPMPNIVISIIIGGGFVGLKLILEHLLKRSIIGWGDVKLLIIVLLFLKIDQLPYLFFICGILLLCGHTLIQSKTLPLAPFIFISSLLVLADI